MKKSLVILFSSLALILCPLLVMAASHAADAAKEPAPAAAATEHADDKAKFQRDTHDMGMHKGEEQRQEQDQDKDKDKDKDKGKTEGADDNGKEKAKNKQKSKQDHNDHQHGKDDKK
jgi:Skp family chaperone for outer membrane proteins